ncbi:hypothetical protein [Streptomyces antimycoticus]|uniref:hypothetical protein n=1 Tax=Streptomyces antimycoticus TaxID=68175 RepID=UPI000A37F27C|nr:hypothetical protein [Streptomyces antimycoticus]
MGCSEGTAPRVVEDLGIVEGDAVQEAAELLGVDPVRALDRVGPTRPVSQVGRELRGCGSVRPRTARSGTEPAMWDRALMAQQERRHHAAFGPPSAPLP